LGGLQFKTAQTKRYQVPISTGKLGLVTYTCHPSYIGDISKRFMIQADPQKKHKTLSER
jgi:hypothetical protein